MILTLILSVLSYQGYSVSSRSLSPQAGELSAAQANNKALQHLGSIQYPRGEEVAELELWKLPSRPRYWELNVPEEIDMILHSETGDLLEFSDPLHDLTTPGRSPTQYPTEALAKARADLLTTGVGRPVTSITKTSSYVSESAQTLGILSVKYEDQRNGRPVIGAYAVLELDVVTGYVVSLSQNWAYTVQADTLTLTPAEGISAASAVYEAALAPANCYAHDSAKPAYLAYMIPNDGWGATGFPAQDAYPRPMRLGWFVPFGKDHVWIDAGDGHLMGGNKSPERP